MSPVCPVCGSGKYLTEFTSVGGQHRIECNNENCSWYGDADELDEGEDD